MPVSVAAWLEPLGLGKYADLFAENEIDLDAARHLTDDDLREIGLPIGPRRKILHAIAALGDSSAFDPAPPGDQQATPVAAERRQVTVLFCDLVGSTALAADLDPEDLRDLLTRYQDAVAGTIVRHDGYVANYLGDGVLAYFGWPRARENQAAQALRAGLAAVAAVRSLGTPGGPMLSARVGIATGQVVIGDLDGRTGRQVGAISGESPNLAARLQGEAAPGEVVIDPATRAIVTGEFELSDLGPRALKGFGTPVTIYRVDAEATSESRFAAHHAESLTPFIGRQNELGLLEERWATAASGEGQVVILSGEPGIGKSRLCQQLLERISGQPHFRLRYQCSPRHVNSAFYPIVRQLERAAEIRDNDSVDEKLDKLEAALRSDSADISRAAPSIARIMALPVDRYPPVSLSPQRQKEMVVEALLDQIEGLTRVKPALMLLEDAHWIDPTSLEAFGAIAARAEAVPLFLLVTARPEAELPWTIGGHVSKLSLARLPKGQCMDLARSVIGHEESDSATVQRIVARTDGIPLFVEELARSLRGRTFGTMQQEIPPTLQALLSSRLDHVSPAARTTAQVGSIVGREFGVDVVRALGERPVDEIDAAVDELAEAGIVTRRGSLQDLKIVFRHALIEEAAYHSQLLSTRRQRHLRIADWYERRVSGGEGADAEVIAHHLIRAGETARALPHLYAAAKRASGGCAYHEAIAHLTAGLDMMRSAGRPDLLGRWRLPFLTAVGTAIMAVRGYGDREAGELLREASMSALRTRTPTRGFRSSGIYESIIRCRPIWPRRAG